ncbi:sugar ABC transporter ATP-binding protein [Staphylococcus gallinarum]|nr:sugar ABC transporter ATP-binding protein [Staphylococcus gallinarum]MCD8919552.1 sugar ABC transporter ATP-binding protein [Staphylococcus gallinarum]MEB6277027.1 sugar ABC transporter ATP-binding protein [Staphylococcus gallinarum]MEB7038057.1 sugar ABC transporter ATP-binding protein [Staphylococcus gallinarum]UEH01567.1 sugar ABC transporter ATP-binding protein [Staphylococcus gallinarum]
MMIGMNQIYKSFGQNDVLMGVDLEIREAEVHALMGENGAGKSTLMKILTGVYKADKGTIYDNGHEVQYKNTKDAEENGIAFIQQELNIWPNLTVLENLFLGKEKVKRFGLIDNKTMRKEALALFEKLNLKIELNELASNLSVGMQQMLEISKALMQDAKIIIMDEPTAALTNSEITVLFEQINKLKSEGVSFVYISHRMEEIFELSDRITVMRDGRSILTTQTEQTTQQQIIKAMIGRDLDHQYPHRNFTASETILTVQNLNSKAHGIENVNFELNKGEILGFSGLMGAGRSEIMRVLFGLDVGQMHVELAGQPLHINNPNQAIKQGLAFITENRKEEGLVLQDTIVENMTLPALKSFSKTNLLVQSSMDQYTDQMIQRLNIKGRKENSCIDLSGGNQQKVVLAKWIATAPRVLILDEPTRGIDVGAKREIYQLMNELTERGMSIIMISSELPEVIGMSDRVAVVHEGHIAGILNKDELSEEHIMTLATGGNLDATI